MNHLTDLQKVMSDHFQGNPKALKLYAAKISDGTGDPHGPMVSYLIAATDSENAIYLAVNDARDKWDWDNYSVDSISEIAIPKSPKILHESY